MLSTSGPHITFSFDKRKVYFKNNMIDMKTILFILLVALGMDCKSQITMDTALQSANLVYSFNTVRISNTETKYYSADTLNNTFTLYNMDFSPLLSNLIVPVPFIKNL